MQTKNRFLLLYYTVLILIMLTYTSMNGAPTPIRLAYLAALLIPLTTNIQFFPAILILTIIVMQNTFAYPLVPDGIFYYVIISVLFAIIALLHKGQNQQIDKGNHLSLSFVLLIAYLALFNIFRDGSIQILTSSSFICIMLYICAYMYLPINSKLIAIAYMAFTQALSYWIIFHPEARFLAAHGEEESTWADPNYLGGMAGIGCIIAIMYLLYAKRSSLQLVLCILTIAGGLYFLSIMTSRGAFLAVGVGTVSLVLFSKTKRSTKLLTSLGIIAVILFVYYSETFELLMERFNSSDDTGAGRTIIWEAKLKGFLQEGNVFDLIFGYGVNDGFAVASSTLGRARAFHNDFVAVLVEYGIVGLVLFLCVLAYPYRIARKEDKPVIAALLLYIITLGMTLEPITSGRFVFVSLLFFIIVLAKSGVNKGAIAE